MILFFFLKDLKTNSSPDIRIFLVGTKADLEDERKVTKEEAMQFVKEYEIDYFIDTIKELIPKLNLKR